MEESHQNQKIFTYTFKHEFKKIVDTLKNVKKTFNICAGLSEGLGNLNFTKKSNSWEVGAEYDIEYKNIQLSTRTIEYFETEDLVRIKWKVFKISNMETDFYLTYNIYNDITNMYTTLVIEVCSNFNKNILNLSNKQFSNRIFYFYNTIEKYIENKSFKSEEQKITIKSSFDTIKLLITDFKKLQKLIPSFCYKIDYKGQMKVGTEITFTTKINTFFGVAYLKVITMEEKENSFKFSFSCSEGNPSIPKQKIVWRITELSNNQCCLEFNHLYNEEVDMDILNFCSKEKQKILFRIREILEN